MHFLSLTITACALCIISRFSSLGNILTKWKLLKNCVLHRIMFLVLTVFLKNCWYLQIGCVHIPLRRWWGGGAACGPSEDLWWCHTQPVLSSMRTQESKLKAETKRSPYWKTFKFKSAQTKSNVLYKSISEFVSNVMLTLHEQSIV